MANYRETFEFWKNDLFFDEETRTYRFCEFNTDGTSAMNEDLDRAQQCVEKAIELSRGPDGKEKDVRMLVTLARVQLARGDTARGKGTLRKVSSRLGELSEYEKEEFEELRKSAR